MFLKVVAKLRCAITYAALLLCITACHEKSNEWSRFVALNPEGWSDTQTAAFIPADDAFPYSGRTPESRNEANGRYDVILCLRHNSATPYSRIYLHTETCDSTGVIRTDTLAVQLTGPNHRWIGKTDKTIVTFCDTILRDTTIPPGWEFSFKPATAKPLRGFMNAGIIISRHDTTSK